MSEKTKKIQEVLEGLNKLFPNLDKILVNDLDNPDYIMIATTSYFNYVSKNATVDSFRESYDLEEDISSKGPDLSKKKYH